MLIAFLHGAPVAAQERTPVDTVELLAELITVEDGLPQGMVQCMLQDKAGYLWFGTRGGLARSDGYGFTVFQHDDADSASIGSNIIRALAEDDAGFLWVGMESGEVDRFDPRTETFMHVVNDPDARAGLWPEIRAITADRNGNVWVQSAKEGLRVARPVNAGERPVLQRPHTVLPHVQWPTRIDHVCIAGDAALWFAFGDSMMVLDPAVERVTHRSRVGNAPAGVPQRGELLLSCPDAEGTGIWFSRTHGLFHFKEPGHGRLHIVNAAAPMACMKEMQGHLWVSNGTCHRIRTSDGKREELRFSEIHGKRLKPEMMVSSWLEDRSGNIWVGTNGYGVLKVTRMRQRFHRVPDVAMIYKASSSGALVLASPGKDLWTDASGSIRSGDVADRLRMHGLMPTPNIRVRDATGRTWVSAAPGWDFEAELTLVDPSGGIHLPSLVPADLSTRNIHPGNGDEAWAMAYNRSTSWTGITDVLCFDTRTERLIRRYPFPYPHHVWSDITEFAVGPDTTIWITTKRGLVHLDPVTGTWDRYQHVQGDDRSLPSDELNALCFDPIDPEHVLWIGTANAGLVKFDPRQGVLDRFTTKEGSPNNVIHGILADERRNLWFSTDMGLCRLDPRTKEVIRYTHDDGLLSNEFNTRASGSTADGRMFFAGPLGTTWFRPAEFLGRASSATTALTGLRLTDRDVVVNSTKAHGEREPLLARNIGFTQAITLPYDERMITFTFAYLDHTLPKANTFRYRLEGFDERWIEAGTTHEATFTNLDPGRYTFHVQGRNSGGVWDEDGARMALVITPPWWGTWWFRIAVALAVIAAFYAFYRYRMAQAAKVVRVRERIARDLHDEIGSTLSSVQLYSAVAQRKAAGKAPEAGELLGRITESTTQVMEAMNDIVWAVNADNDNMAQVVQRMHAYAVGLSEAGGFTLRFDVQQDLHTLRLGMAERKNLYLIFKEAVNNVAKYARCTDLRIELHRARGLIVLRITDDGTGFHPTAENPDNGGGNGLPNIRARAAELGGTCSITSTPGQGTIVELRFVPGADGRSLEPMRSPGHGVR